MSPGSRPSRSLPSHGDSSLATTSGEADRNQPPPHPAARVAGTAFATRAAMHSHRATLPRRPLLRRLADEAREIWDSLIAAELPRNPPAERVRRFCDDCEKETPHEAFDELGLGWYAQIWRCRHCGRQAIRVWAFGAW